MRGMNAGGKKKRQRERERERGEEEEVRITCSKTFNGDSGTRSTYG